MTSTTPSPAPLTKGQILFWTDSRNPENNKTKDKLFIVLGVSKEWVLVAITTSQPYEMKNSPGCHEDGKYYFIRMAKHTWFDKDTWVLLESHESRMLATVLSNIKSGKVKAPATLPINETNALIKCLLTSNDISPACVEEFFAK